MLNDIFVYIRNINRKNLDFLTSLNSTRLKGIAGFGLFEFMLVLIIISILVSVLIPKFMEVKSEAHKSHVQLSANSLQSAVNIVHSLWQSQGSKDNVVIIKNYEEGKVLVGPTGWPIDVITVNGVDTNISRIEHNDDDFKQKYDSASVSKKTCERLWNGLLKESTPEVEFESNSIKTDVYLFEFYQGTCRFRYLLSEDDFRIEYDLATGQINTFFEHY